MAQSKGSDKSQTDRRKGGLGRGLAALIPSGPSNSPGLGGGAADIILGGSVGERARRAAEQPAPEAAAPAPESPAPPVSAPAAPTEASASAPADTATVEFGASYREIPIDSITPNPQQPRSEFDQQALDELVHSIREFGLMQPIVVRPRGEGYELIMGERRWRASRRAGLEVIPAIVRETEDTSMLRDALLENIHRVQLNPLEEAAAYQQLLEEFGVTQAELADKLGRSRPVITNMIRLLSLPVAVQTKVAAGVLSAGHARAILGLRSGEADQDALATRIIAEGLSVRATEEIVLLHNRGDEPEKKAPREKAPTPEIFTRAAESLADNLDTKVSVSMGRNKGRLVVEFGDRDDFERIMSLIQGR